MECFFGDDPMSCATLKDPKVFIKLMDSSMCVFKHVEGRMDKNESLRQVYAGAGARINESGI
jgi:hypothetical protein